MQQVVSLLLVGKTCQYWTQIRVTAYHIRFIMKLLWKECGCSITLIFIELKFLWVSSKSIQIFY